MNATTLWRLDAGAENCTPNPVLFDEQYRTIDEISLTIPGGVYTTFRTYHHDHVLSLKQHFSRLEESARLLGKTIRVDQPVVRQALRTVLAFIGTGDLRVRITVDLEEAPGTIYISTEPLHAIPDEVYWNGGKAVTHRVQRPIPGAKLTGHIETAARVRENYPDQEYSEILIVNAEDIILEGLSSNFFSVQQGVVYTAGEGVLPGTIRGLAIELARLQGIQVAYEGVRLGDLSLLAEAFITSTSRGILPIVCINGIAIGSGRPGPNTKKLMAAYTTWVLQTVEPI